MNISKKRMKELLMNERFPRSSKYDPEWVLNGWMGPNALWLTEWLCEKMALKLGMRVLDMGCGKALSSIFLAKEYGVQVFANDLWISATENWQRIKDAGMENQVIPIHAEAHALPYAEGFFDTIVSMDSYQYYGTDDLYLLQFQKLLRPGGQIGIVVPGLVREFKTPPAHLLKPRANGAGPLWVDECRCFHTASWWQQHWERCSAVENITADYLPEAVPDWIQYEKACEEAGTLMFPSEVEPLEADGGRYLALIGVTGRKK